jgi:hypothetical protein
MDFVNLVFKGLVFAAAKAWMTGPCLVLASSCRLSCNQPVLKLSGRNVPAEVIPDRLAAHKD